MLFLWMDISKYRLVVKLTNFLLQYECTGYPDMYPGTLFAGYSCLSAPMSAHFIAGYKVSIFSVQNGSISGLECPLHCYPANFFAEISEMIQYPAAGCWIMALDASISGRPVIEVPLYLFVWMLVLRPTIRLLQSI